MTPGCVGQRLALLNSQIRSCDINQHRFRTAQTPQNQTYRSGLIAFLLLALRSQRGTRFGCSDIRRTLLIVRHMPNYQHHSCLLVPVFAVLTNGPLIAVRFSDATLKMKIIVKCPPGTAENYHQIKVKKYVVSAAIELTSKIANELVIHQKATLMYALRPQGMS
jgi:hypothetical protein